MLLKISDIKQHFSYTYWPFLHFLGNTRCVSQVSTFIHHYGLTLHFFCAPLRFCNLISCYISPLFIFKIIVHTLYSDHSFSYFNSSLTLPPLNSVPFLLPLFRKQANKIKNKNEEKKMQETYRHKNKTHKNTSLGTIMYKKKGPVRKKMPKQGNTRQKSLQKY